MIWPGHFLRPAASAGRYFADHLSVVVLQSGILAEVDLLLNERPM